MTTNEIKSEHSFNEVQQTQILNAVHKFLQWNGNAYESNQVISNLYLSYLDQHFDCVEGEDNEYNTCMLYYKHFNEVTITYRLFSDLCIAFDRVILKT